MGSEPQFSATKPPPLAFYLTDLPRAIGGFGASLVVRSLLANAAPRGDGHPVLVLPGLMAGDMSTLALRRFLRRLGYQVHGWRLGRNIGPTALAVGGMQRRLEELSMRHGRTISVIGWSLGGIYARELARHDPHVVRQVITLGSPFRMTNPRHSRAHRAYRRFSDQHLGGSHIPPSEETRGPLEVPVTSVYSKLDGIVPWRACIDDVGPIHENVAVLGSHFGLGHDPAVLWLIADRLALPEGAWRPFKPPALARFLYPRPAVPMPR